MNFLKYLLLSPLRFVQKMNNTYKKQMNVITIIVALKILIIKKHIYSI